MREVSDQAVLDILQQRSKEASIADFSPHDFRRTFIRGKSSEETICRHAMAEKHI